MRLNGLPGHSLRFGGQLGGQGGKWGGEKKFVGDGGYRSPYLSHAKRALYHLSYVPWIQTSLVESLSDLQRRRVDPARLAMAWLEPSPACVPR